MMNDQITAGMIESFLANTLSQKALIDAIDPSKMTPIEFMLLFAKITPFLDKVMGFAESLEDETE